MRLYSLCDDITYTITQNDSSMAEWTLQYEAGSQAASFGSIDISDDSIIDIASGTVRGTTTLHLTEVIARFLSQPFCIPSFACDTLTDADKKPSAAFYPDRAYGQAFTSTPEDPGAQLFRIQYINSSGNPVYSEFEVWRDQVAAFKLKNPSANDIVQSSTNWQNQGAFPLCLNQPIDTVIYDSSWSMETQVTVLNAGCTPDNTNNAQKGFGIYFIAFPEGVPGITRPEQITWSDLFSGSITFSNDLDPMTASGLTMLAFWDNYDTPNWPAAGNTKGAWNPYIIGECSISDYFDSGSGSIPDSASMPYWDPKKGQSSTTGRSLDPNYTWSLYLLTVGGVFYSSGMSNNTAKWTKLGTYSPCKPDNIVQVRYLNQYGAIDSLWMTAARRTNVTRSPETYQRNVLPSSYEHATTIYQQEIRYEYTLNTPVLDDRQSQLLMLHLFQSPAIWIWDESLIENDLLYPENTRSNYDWTGAVNSQSVATRYGLIPVNLKDTSMTVKTRANDKVFNYTLTFESANPFVKF